MPTFVSQITELALAELLPDGFQPTTDLDLDLDRQDVDLHAPESQLEIALPGRW